MSQTVAARASRRLYVFIALRYVLLALVIGFAIAFFARQYGIARARVLVTAL